MKMPKRVTIGPLTFNVRQGKNHRHAAERAAGVTLDGYSRVSESTIVVAKTLSPDYERVVLLHEVIHMCLGVASCEMEDAVEERFVSALTATLLDTLQTNPELLAYLLLPEAS